MFQASTDVICRSIGRSSDVYRVSDAETRPDYGGWDNP